MNLTSRIFPFFEQHIDTGRSLVVALSGGPDSMCLLHLLIAWNKVPLHIAHVDHGWRQESKEECQILEVLAKEHGIPFHITRLTPAAAGNLEDACRNERLRFYTGVVRRAGAQAVALGHQAQDLAETVFKRVLEGASLPALRAMQPISKHDSLILLRPLLDVTKQEILSYLKQHSIPYFTDPTNDEVRFLRGQLRTTVFPFLRKAFGKAFEDNLCAIAKDASRLSEYLEHKLEPYMCKRVHSKFGAYFERVPESEFELHNFVKQVAKHDGLSRTEVEILVTLLQQKSANKKVIRKNAYIADRGRLFVVSPAWVMPQGACRLVEGVQEFGPWTITVTACEAGECKNHWRDLFLGTSYSVLPKGSYTISSLNSHKFRKFFEQNAKKATKILKKYFNKEKTPHFLIERVPMIVENDIVVEDFITGTKVEAVEGALWSIQLAPK